MMNEEDTARNGQERTDGDRRARARAREREMKMAISGFDPVSLFVAAETKSHDPDDASSSELAYNYHRNHPTTSFVVVI